MGLLICLYNPENVTPNKIVNIFSEIFPEWTSYLDEMLVQRRPGHNFIKTFNKSIFNEIKPGLFEIYKAGTEIDMGMNYYDELFKICTIFSDNYIFLYIKEIINADNLGVFLSKIEALNELPCSYGFCTRWPGECMDGYRYATGIHLVLPHEDIFRKLPEDVAKWARDYRDESRWKRKLRDIYPVNFLHGGPDGGHYDIIERIKSDPGFFGDLVELSKDHFAWIVDDRRKDAIRGRLGQFML